MKFSEIDTFLAIVETGSLTKAAEMQFMSQSTVSHQLKNLEDELGITLIRRQKGQRDIVLTKEGEKFIPLAQRWMALWKDMHMMQKSTPSAISIGCPRNLLTYVLPSLIKELQDMSGIHLKINAMRSSEVYDMVEKREIDIGFAFEQPQKQSSVNSEPMFSEKMYLMRIKRTNVTCFEINPRFLDPEYEVYFPWFQEYVIWHDACWEESNGHPMEINSSALIPIMLKDPKRWMIAPLSIAINMKKDLPLEIVKLTAPPPNRTCYKLTHKNPRLVNTPALEKISDIIDEFCENLPWEELEI